MIFLIEYDRGLGKLTRITSFDDKEREAAEKARLATELRFYRIGLKREVVLLQAEDENALRETHRRYFVDVARFARAG